MPTFQKCGENPLSFHSQRGRARICAWLLPPSMPGCLQHPWRWIAAASSCPLSSPENNEANNFFNYLSRAASSVNKFVWLSPAGLAFYFIGFFHRHLKHVLLFILISTENFFSCFSFYILYIFFGIISCYSFVLSCCLFCCFSSVPYILWDTTWLLIDLLPALFLSSLPLSLHWKELGMCIICIVHWAIEFPVYFQDWTWEKTGLFLWVSLLQISPFAVLLWTILINSCEMANKPNLHSVLMQWERRFMN